MPAARRRYAPDVAARRRRRLPRRTRLPPTSGTFSAVELGTGLAWGPGSGTRLQSWMHKVVAAAGAGGLPAGWTRTGIPLTFDVTASSGGASRLTVALAGPPGAVYLRPASARLAVVHV